jgi:ubiquitin-conjugating enzyme E2 W
MRSITVWIVALAWMTEQALAYKSHAPFDSVATTRLPPPSAHQSRRHHDREADKEGFEFHLNLLMSIRAGSLDIGKSESGFVLTKVRNIVRSLLSTVEASAPPVAALFRGFLGTVEVLTGVSLLPLKEEPEKGKKKKKSGSTKKKKKTTTPSEDESAEKPPPSKQSTAKKAAESKPTKKSAKNASSMASEWQKKEIKTTSPNYRIQRELKAFLSEPPPNLSVKVGKNLRVWIVTMKGAKNTIYEGEAFKLRISFPSQYPDVPPSVYFLPPNIPLHEHVYTNGDICLSLLGKDWRPSMTAQSIAVSILSILSSAQSKSLPMDNARHAQNRPGVYQENWV